MSATVRPEDLKSAAEWCYDWLREDTKEAPQAICASDWKMIETALAQAIADAREAGASEMRERASGKSA